ncbi:MAG: helix-turn-helix transcriptional regulator [Alphaproteobacteria bacterium]|nr:helix-turn-helix transcriptional regulator [Alphaproteobacteria bacterium]
MSAENLRRMHQAHPAIEEALQLPSQSKSQFDSLRALATHLKQAFAARLSFVSRRRAGADEVATFPYDTAQSAFSAQRTLWYAAPIPLDVAVVRSCCALLCRPEQMVASAQPDVRQQSARSGDSGTVPIVFVPYRTADFIAICAVHVDESAAENGDYIERLSGHCIQYLGEHFRHYPQIDKARLNVLSPQEERVVLACAEGLTDKQIGRDMDISPHTVRAHLNNAKSKLGARNKTHAAIIYTALLRQR